MSPSAPALTLALPPTIYVAGGFIEGEVLIDFRQLQQENIQEVYLKLRGVLQTMVRHDKSTLRDACPLLHANLSLWARGAAYPPPGTDTLRLPFRLPLPPSLPPSFHFRGSRKSASVLYALTAVGVRPGTFQINRRLQTPLVILPSDPVGAQIRAGAEHGWKKVRAEEKIRKGLWGDYATVQVELTLPDVPVLPLFADIPFKIEITTRTAPLARAKADAHPPDKPVFPAPPAVHTGVSFRLSRRLHVRAARQLAPGTVGATSESDEAAILGFPRPDVETYLAEKEWVPAGADPGAKRSSREAVGAWVQRARFEARMWFNVPPTFATELIQCEYCLSLKVPFPGLGNDVKVQLPVIVSSGIDAPVVRGTAVSAPVRGSASGWRSESDAAGLGPAESQGGHARVPTATLDLPPAYWDVGDSVWAGLEDKN